MREIKKVAVLGAGVMGSGIAAHVANAGIPVLLLDIVPEGADNRNVVAAGAVEKMLKAKPAPFFNKRAAKLVEVGNLEDDLDKLADCDWICEAIIENLQIKQDLYTRLESVVKDTTIVTSNTSTIPLGHLVDGRGETFKSNFAISHFFNPPRYMKLLEVVKGAHTSDEAYAALKAFGDVKLGKDVVDCKDTPGFIANRVGIHWMNAAIQEAFRLGLTPEEADSVCGKPLGMPKTGIFGLTDLVGIDLSPKVVGSMIDLLPADDVLPSYFDADSASAKMIATLIERGDIGRKAKSKSGFYRRRKDGGKNISETLDLTTGEYRAKQRANLASVKAGRKGIKALLAAGDKGSEYAWEVLKNFAGYASLLVGEIADNIYQIDLAMRTGYGLKYGPFQLIDQMGVADFAARLEADGFKVGDILKVAGDQTLYKEDENGQYFLGLDGTYHLIDVAEGAWMLADIKRGAEPIAKNSSASIWDLGDGVACLEFHSKMNSVDAGIIEMVKTASKLHTKGYKALVIGNDADNFSVGANIGVALFQANMAMWPVVEQSISEGQNAYMALKYAPFPVVAAPAGMALGGGCEICLHADAIQAHGETYMGLVEVGVGVIPGWGGCKEMITRRMLNKRRAGGPMPALSSVFEDISTAKVATSAAEAKDMLFLRDGDGITMNRRRVLADAKAKALALAETYEAPEPVEISLPGRTASTAFKMAVDGFVDSGKATKHDRVVSHALAEVVGGGDTDITDVVTEKQLLKLEREAFMSLLKTKGTLDRIEHMLDTGKPLRN